MLEIRLFKPTDIFPVIKLASLTLPERYNPSIFNFFYETYPKGFIIAEKAHKIIGFCIGVKVNEELSKILMLSVSERFRKQNIGSALINRFFQEISNEVIKHIELEVRCTNRKAIKFYQKHGFEIIDKIKEFYQDGSNAYTMRKEI